LVVPEGEVVVVTDDSDVIFDFFVGVLPSLFGNDDDDNDDDDDIPLFALFPLATFLTIGEEGDAEK
jgi:hypothetical protein